jgi:5-methyltetrahydropteroyltriglutamate--homocysteine methyltransferase
VIAASALSLLYPADGIDGYPREAFLADLVSEAASDIRGALDGGAHSVPFLVSNYGILSATRSTAPHGSLSSNRRVITRIGGSDAAGRGVRPPSSRLSRIPGQETRSGRWRALGLSVVQSLGGAGRRIWV